MKKNLNIQNFQLLKVTKHTYKVTKPLYKVTKHLYKVTKHSYKVIKCLNSHIKSLNLKICMEVDLDQPQINITSILSSTLALTSTAEVNFFDLSQPTFVLLEGPLSNVTCFPSVSLHCNLIDNFQVYLANIVMFTIFSPFSLTYIVT